MELVLSSLPKTWILDLDGTLVKHNGYLIDGYDTLLPGVENFLQKIDENDLIIIITSRKHDYKERTEAFLTQKGIRFSQIIYDAPFGERILINDNKPSGLKMSFAIDLERDCELDLEMKISEEL